MVLSNLSIESDRDGFVLSFRPGFLGAGAPAGTGRGSGSVGRLARAGPVAETNGGGSGCGFLVPSMGRHRGRGRTGETAEDVHSLTGRVEFGSASWNRPETRGVLILNLP